jgi:hypothetical protein
MNLSVLMIPEVVVGAANFLNVFIRAFQQRNVAHLHYRWVMPTSAMFALGDMVVIASVAALGPSLWMWLSLALGGGLGCLASMKLHETLVKHKSVVDTTSPLPSSPRSILSRIDSTGVKETSSSISQGTEEKAGQRTYEKLSTTPNCS